MKKRKIEIVQDQEKTVPAEILAGAIVEMGEAMKVLSKSKLNRAAILTLVKDKTGISKAAIGLVLDSLESLEKDWIK